MALRSAVKYIGEFIRRELGIGCYLAATVAQGDTSMRVLDPMIFDPTGGTVFRGDDMITYGAMNGDQLTSVPASGTGKIPDGGLAAFSAASPDMIYVGHILSEAELERYIDRYRIWVDALELHEDVEKKKYWHSVGWFDTGVAVRDDDDSSFSAVVPDTVSYERGEFEFTTARTESTLYVAGWRYNPYYSIADIVEMIANDDRRFTYFQVGQTAMSKKDLFDSGLAWRKRGAILNFV